MPRQDIREALTAIDMNEINLRIDNLGSAILDKDLNELEANTGFPLPPDYREFLLKFNGGQPTPYEIEIDGLDESPTDVQVFFGIGRSEKTSNIAWNWAELSERLEDVGLPIASDSGGALFVLRRDNSVVYLLPFEENGSRYVVATSFSDFVGKLC